MTNEQLEELFCELDNLHNLAMWEEFKTDIILEELELQ
jgi:hypothetical protein